MTFYVGLHHPNDARHFQRSFISINALKSRKSHFSPSDWIMDSGAFTEISTHGRYRSSVEIYAQRIYRWSFVGNLLAAVSQDYMCEAHILKITGLTIADHQRLTIERYDTLRSLVSCCYILPVLQGYQCEDYLSHLDQYGDRFQGGAWVGVGSVCKRNTNVQEIETILSAIKERRPDLKLHGFGLKVTALGSPLVRSLLHSSDSMAWSDAARKESNIMRMKLEKELGRKLKPRHARAILAERGIRMRDANDWREARTYSERIEALCN
jgi:hypothetical protein